MSESTKYILASGCSFTDKNFKSNIVEHKDFPKWPELLGKMLDKPVVNVAECGVSNDWIEKSIINRVISDSDNIELVVIGFTETWRYSVYNLMHHNPLAWFDQQDRTSDHWDTASRVKSIPYYRFMIEERLANEHYQQNENLFQIIVNNHIETIIRIQKICKKYKIKLIAANLLNAFHQGRYIYCVKSLGKEFHYNEDQWAWMIQNSPKFNEVDNHTLIGWPFHPYINGWSLGAEILTDKERIAPDKGDHHPNKKGHELIAEVFYDKYQEIYE